MPERQIAPHVPPMGTPIIFNPLLDEPDQSVDRYPKKNYIDFSSSMLKVTSVVQSTDVIDVLYHKVDIGTDSVVTAVQKLINIVGKNETGLFDSLTENHYQQLVAVLDNLINIVGNNEDHILASIMDFIGTLIKNYEDRHVPELTVI